MRGLAAWRWLFIIEGVASFVAGLLSFFILPDFPGMKTGINKWLLTDLEQKVAVERMAADQVSQPQGEAGILAGLRLACADPNTWLFVSLIMISRISHLAANTCQLVPHTPCKPQRLRVHQFLPDHRQGFQPRWYHNYPPPNGATVHTCCHLCLFNGVV